MKNGPNIAPIAALIGDPARANMLSALMSGKALTATELSIEANVSAQTASSHLKKLLEGGLLTLRKQGRHRYYAIAGEDIIDVLSSLMGIADKGGHSRTHTGPRDGAMRKARRCYNHLAGEMGTQLFDFLAQNSYISSDAQLTILTPLGRDFVSDFGIDVEALENKPVLLCRECLDWSARRSHLAGSLGRAFLTRFETLGWARPDTNSRAVLFTPQGSAQFNQHFTRPTVIDKLGETP